MRPISLGICVSLFQSLASLGAPLIPLQPDVPYTNSDPNEALWTPTSGSSPQPVRSGKGGSILGPDNVPLDLQNADSLAPPTTDSGDLDNYKWPFSLSHNRIQNGGWSRQQNGICYPFTSCFNY